MEAHIIKNDIYVIKSYDTENINTEYTFLSHSKNKEYYYNILRSQNNYQLKSLYDFIFEHSNKCAHLLDRPLNQFQGTDKLNEEFKNFLNMNIFTEIFLINLIRVYFR
jgi:hypothetical protein